LQGVSAPQAAVERTEAPVEMQREAGEFAAIVGQFQAEAARPA